MEATAAGRKRGSKFAKALLLSANTLRNIGEEEKITFKPGPQADCSHLS